MTPTILLANPRGFCAGVVSNFDEPEPETVTLGDGTLVLTCAKVLLVHTHWSAP
ncbi:MAG: hypothetical protein ACYCZT_13705 [Thiobacillus sp.]